MSFLDVIENQPVKERFSLLLLEPAEIYFQDFSAHYYPPLTDGNKHKKGFQEGRLKMCSMSVVFDPLDFTYPMLKFPLEFVTDIEELKDSLLFSYGGETLTITTTQHLEMREKNIISPYRFIKEQEIHTFSLIFAALDDCLRPLLQLHRAASLPVNDKKLMIDAIVRGRQMQVKFNTSWLEQISEKLLLELQVDQIHPLVANPGRLMLTPRYLYFQPFNNLYPVPVIKVKLSKIKRLICRRFMLRHVGLELYTTSLTTSEIYLAFKSKSDRDRLYNLILQQFDVILEPLDPGDKVLKWQTGQLSNYDYLLYLNLLGDRSFNDFTQYPIVPWVIADYTSSHLDLSSASTFRDLSKPIGALNVDRLAGLKERYDEMPEPKFLYGSHYSTPGYVLFYLARVTPEYMLCLHNGKFDHPDRMFNNIADTWKNCLVGQADFKELIPEFYNDKYCAFLQKNPFVNFGTRSVGRPVADVELPSWSANPTDFVHKMREALECDYVSQNLHHWIDLVFGYKQIGKAAVEANNVFYYLTYEGAVDLNAISDPAERAGLQVQIMEFGQVPKQLFTSPHPQKLSPYISIPDELSAVCKSEIETNVLLLPDLLGTQPDARQEKSSHISLSTITTFVLYHRCKLHKQSVKSVIYAEQSNSVISIGLDGMLKVYSLEDRSQQRSVSFSSMALSSVCNVPDNSVVLVGSWDNNVYVYSMNYAQTLHTLHAHDDAVSCIYWVKDLLFTGSWDSTVKVWSCILPTSSQRLSLKFMTTLDHDSRVTCLDVDLFNDLLVTGIDDGTVQLWSCSDYQPLDNYHAHLGSVTSVVISSEFSRVLSSGEDTYVHIWDIQTGTEVYSQHLGSPLMCMKLCSNFILIGTQCGDVIFYDVHLIQQVHTVHGHTGAITCVDMTRDVLVMGSDDGTVAIWKSAC